MNVARPTPQAGTRNGRPPAEPLTEAFARYQGEILGTLLYLVGNAEDARDALQETFVKCWRHRDQVEDIANLKAWIFRIALNTGRDLRGAAWRRRRVNAPPDGWIMPSSQCGPLEQMQRDEELAGLRRAVSALRSEEQEVFLLRQNGDMTYDQIAAAVGIPVGTVKTRMRLALGKLRLALENT